MKKIDYKAIAEYQQGKITQEDAADRLMCTPEYVDEYIIYIEGDNLSNRDYDLREELRRYGSAYVSMQEGMSRMECPIGQKWMGRV